MLYLMWKYTFNRLYEADIIFFKVIDNKLLEVAHGEISHGYSDIKEPQNPELVVLDCETLKALKYEKLKCQFYFRFVVHMHGLFGNCYVTFS